MKLQKFVPLTKMEEQSDGTLHVSGIVTAQLPDLDKEVCDYEGTKANYQKRAAENLQKTSVPGMVPSLMPFREMHQLITQGAGRSIEYDDAAKTIRMTFHVVDSNAVAKWRAGCFVGFSQGGAYEKKWADPDFPGCTRYIADPSEVSAVDAPCLPDALVESIKGRTVTLAKADGATEEVSLQVEGARLARIEKALDALSGQIETLLEKQTQILPAPPEETATSGEGEDAVKITDQAGLTKAAKTIHDHLEKLHELHKAAGEHKEKNHEAEMKKHEAVGEHIEKCMKAAKDASEGDEPEEAEKAATPELAKKFEALQAQIADMSKAHTELLEKLAKTPAAPAHTGALDQVLKGATAPPADVPAELAGILNTPPAA